jgi:hypothetical protein
MDVLADFTLQDDDDEEEDKPKNNPPEEALAASVPQFLVECGVMPTDIQFCKYDNILATADMDGKVKM